MTTTGIANKDKHIDEKYGIYTITGVTLDKTSDRRVIYEGECEECGYKRYSSLKSFKQDCVQTCRHRTLLSDEEIEKWYEKNKKQCLYCGKDIPLENLSFSAYKERKFCDNSCSALYNNPLNKKTRPSNNKCFNCGKQLKYTQKKYCSQKCQHEYEYAKYIEKWKSGEESGTTKFGASDRIRKYLIKKYNNQCCKCGWHEINPTTGKIPLEVHHVDGDYTNNKEENLELLCPNCHSLTPTYRALNCGEGRKDRYK